MKYKIIAKNERLNKTINWCFEIIDEDDVKIFRQKFFQQKKSQRLHTFRELLVGTYLKSKGFDVRYDYVIEGKTPDWCILNKHLDPIAIVELTNFHNDDKTEKRIRTKIEDGKIYCDWDPSNNRRLLKTIKKKVRKYKLIVIKREIPYVVALYGDVMSFTEPEEIYETLLEDHDGGIFNKYKVLSGFLYFEESAGNYKFQYTKNPHADNSIDLPNGIF